MKFGLIRRLDTLFVDQKVLCYGNHVFEKMKAYAATKRVENNSGGGVECEMMPVVLPNPFAQLDASFQQVDLTPIQTEVELLVRMNNEADPVCIAMTRGEVETLDNSRKPGALSIWLAELDEQSLVMLQPHPPQYGETPEIRDVYLPDLVSPGKDFKPGNYGGTPIFLGKTKTGEISKYWPSLTFYTRILDQLHNPNNP